MNIQEYIDHALTNGRLAVEYKVTSVWKGRLATDTEVIECETIEDANKFMEACKHSMMRGVLYHGIVLHTK